MTLTYFGHSTFQIETSDTTLLFDPHFADNPHTNVTPDALAPDVLFLSHAHFDHFSDTQAFVEQGDPLVVGNFEIVSYVGKNYNYETVQPLNEGGSLDFEWGTVEAVHARHTSSFPDGSYGGTPVGFVLELDDATVYYAGDTAPFAEMEWIGDLYAVDVMLAPVGGVVTMGLDGALFAADMVAPDTIIPIHYDTFPFIEVDLDLVRSAIEEAGFQAEVLAFDSSLEV